MNNLSIRKMSELSKKKKKGFTLVELIIVIAIIAVLAAIAIPKFGQITRNANAKADIATAKNIHGIIAQLVAEGKTTITDADIEGKLDGTPTAMPKTKLNSANSFAYSYDSSNGDIKVFSGTTSGDEIYPKATGTYVS